MDTLSLISQNVLKVTTSPSVYRVFYFYEYTPKKDGTGLRFKSKENFIELQFADCSSNGVSAFANLAAMSAWLDSQLSEVPNVVSGRMGKATASFTTAVAATAYSVQDVINAAGSASLQSIAVGCKSGYITGISIEMDKGSPLATPTPLPTLRLRLYDSSHPSLLLADNAADVTTYSNNVRRLGFVDLPIMVAEEGFLVTQDEALRIAFANLTNGLLYYKIINVTGTPTLATGSVGRGVFVRMKIDKNI